jgi:aldose 1-epimerase
MAGTLELGDGRWKILVAPARGGSLLGCTFDGAPVLQPAPQPAAPGRPALRCCHFPLIPFSNRIDNGRFRFNGSTVQVARNVAGSPHPLHGHGWQTEWQVSESNGTTCVLTYGRKAMPDWPWPYRARQTIAVAGDSLYLLLAIENPGPAAMPGGLGFHPFFPRSAGARLELSAEQVWNRAAAGFPTARTDIPAALEFHGAPRIADRQGTDHCFDGWSRRATIRYEHPARCVTLDGCQETAHAIVYVPAHADYFCVEPVSHAVNAMNLADPAAAGWWTLDAGEIRSISMTIRCVES